MSRFVLRYRQYALVFTLAHTRSYTCAYTLIHMRIHAHTHAHTRLHICAYTLNTHVHTLTCDRTNAHTLVHTWTRARTRVYQVHANIVSACILSTYTCRYLCGCAPTRAHGLAAHALVPSGRKLAHTQCTLMHTRIRSYK